MLLLELSEKKIYEVLASNADSTTASARHVRALCPVPLQFPQRRCFAGRSSAAPREVSKILFLTPPRPFVATRVDASLYPIVLSVCIRFLLRLFRLAIAATVSVHPMHGVNQCTGIAITTTF
jgi:hypothetical protein